MNNMVKIYYLLIFQLILLFSSFSYSKVNSIIKNDEELNDNIIGQLLSADDNFIFKWYEAGYKSFRFQMNSKKYECMKDIEIINYLFLINSFSINHEKLERKKMLKIIGSLENLKLNERRREKYINFFKKEKINYSLRWQFLQFIKDSANFKSSTYKIIYIIETYNNDEIESHDISLFGVNENTSIRYNYFLNQGKWSSYNVKIINNDGIQNFYNQLNPEINCRPYLSNFIIITKITKDSIESKIIMIPDKNQLIQVNKLIE